MKRLKVKPMTPGIPHTARLRAYLAGATLTPFASVVMNPSVRSRNPGGGLSALRSKPPES